MELTLDKTLKPGQRYSKNIAAHIRGEVIEKVKRAVVGHEQRTAALSTLADHIEGSLDNESQSLVALAAIANAWPGSRWSAREDFDPTPSQSRMLLRLATLRYGATAPPPEVSVDELLTGAIFDFVEAVEQERRGAARKLQEAQVERNKAVEKLADLTESDDECTALRNQLDAATEECNELRQVVEAQRELLEIEYSPPEPSSPESSTPESSTPESPDTPRRVKVEGETGIYENPKADGSTVYEISYPDDNGRTRWKVVGPDLDEARQLRAELTAKPRQEGDDV